MALMLARRAAKVALYMAISLLTGRILGSPEEWLSHGCVSRLGHIIYGPGEIGADNFYDLYFYISVITIFTVTTFIYILLTNAISKIRKS
ncbi:hypothetical protein [uncultured Pluralibacter sp.]|uniref:hypothetical protein n=1 Tax=uncultured Pluralibacter sp. TaxID=1490864 RepID=UPI0026278ABD|nr:hypothetical protein [uncultured Pluralibacter sp.]